MIPIRTQLLAAMPMSLVLGGAFLILSTMFGGLGQFIHEAESPADLAHPGGLAQLMGQGSYGVEGDVSEPQIRDGSTSGGTPGVETDRVVFGQSAALTGPAALLGTNMKLGVEAAFNEVNERGGVNGRRLELTSRDDAYEPEAAIANTRHLIEEERVFALIGAVGTPTSRSATPVALEAGIPYIAPFTGAAFLRENKWKNIVNLRASYNQETEEMVAQLHDGLGLDRIAVLHQDDSFGRAGFHGATRAMNKRGLEPVSVGLYPRNTVAVKTALLDLRMGNPEAVILVGAYKPVAALVLWARRTGLDPVFINISFVGSTALAQELGSAGKGIFVTQVVPYPWDTSIPVVREYHRALEAAFPGTEPGFVSLEGYLAGRMAIAGLEACEMELTRECFLYALRDAGDIDLGGFGLSFGFGDNQGSDKVFLTAIGSDGKYHPIETLRDPVP